MQEVAGTVPDMTLNILKPLQITVVWLHLSITMQKGAIGTKAEGRKGGKGGKKVRSAELCQDSVVKLLILRWGGQTLHTPRPHSIAHTNPSCQNS